MRLSWSKSPILAGLVVALLAAATMLLAGYVDQPGRTAQVLAEDQCAGCPLQGTDACCRAQCDNCPLQGTDACGQAKCDNCPRTGDACCEMKTCSPGLSQPCATTCPAGTGETGSAGGGPRAGGAEPAAGACPAGGCPALQRNPTQ
jgi:hypothetical protein